MTSISHANKKSGYKSRLITLLCILLLCVVLFFGEMIKTGVISGIRLSFNNIIPTLFPFFILSDLWASYVHPDNKSIIAKSFERLFGINSIAFPAFILGTVCGFPLGISYGVNLYKSNQITKSELEALCSLANNPSLAFVVSGVGAGLYKDIRIGALLYISVIISALTVGIFFRSKEKIHNNSTYISRQSFNLVNSVKKAGVSSLTVSVYIIFFSALISLTSELVKNECLLVVISSLLEISNATSLAADLSKDNSIFSLVITAFALGFSGFSVHLQSFEIMPKELSRVKYLIRKLFQGILCALLIALITLLF